MLTFVPAVLSSYLLQSTASHCLSLGDSDATLHTQIASCLSPDTALVQV